MGKAPIRPAAPPLIVLIVVEDLEAAKASFAERGTGRVDIANSRIPRRG